MRFIIAFLLFSSTLCAQIDQSPAMLVSSLSVISSSAPNYTVQGSFSSQFGFTRDSIQEGVDVMWLNYTISNPDRPIRALIDSFTVISGNTLRFYVELLDGETVLAFPTGTASIYRPTTNYGLALTEPNESNTTKEQKFNANMIAIDAAIAAAGGTTIDTTNIVYKETGTDTIVPYPDEFTFRPFDIFRNDTTYYISPDFSLQERANIAVTTTYHVDINTGSDSNNGLSWAAPLKSIHVAMAKSDVDSIAVAKGVFPFANAWRNQSCTRDVKIVGDLTQGIGDSVWITKQMNEKLATAWTNVGSYYWAKYTVSPDTISTVYDSTNADSYGDATALTLVASTALVNSTANSYRVNGDTIFVHTFDNRAPDSHVWLMGKNGSISDLNGNWNTDKTLYLKNICFRGGGVYCTGSSEGSRIYMDSVNVWLYGCFFDGAEEVIILNSVFRTNGGDLLNYDPEAGIFTNVVEYNVKAYNTTNVSCTNCQATTAHDSLLVIRVKGFYADTWGQNAADVGSGKTFMLGCTFRNARPASSQGYYAGGANGYSWLERCTFIDQQVSNDDIYGEAPHHIYTRFNVPDEGNAGGNYYTYTPNETFGSEVSEMMTSNYLGENDVLYVAKKADNNEYISAQIQSNKLFENSGALLKGGTIEGAQNQAQTFRKAVEVNGLTGGAISAKALTTTTPALKIQATTGQTAAIAEIYDASSILRAKFLADGSAYFGDVASGSGNFSFLGATGNQIVNIGGKTAGQQVNLIMYGGPTFWNPSYQSSAFNGDLLLRYNNTSGGRLFRFTTTGRLAIGDVAATGKLHITANGGTANNVPIKLESGALTASPEVGAIEFLTDKLYFGITTGPARKELTLNDVTLNSGEIPTGTTNGRLTNSGLLTNVTSAVLSTPSTAKGFLGPVMTTTQRNAIASPATGLQVYNTSNNKLNYYNGSAWMALPDSATADARFAILGGNSGAVTIGSNDNTTTLEAGGVGRYTLTSSAHNFELIDNQAGALLVAESANEYFRANTLNGSELINIGNTGGAIDVNIYPLDANVQGNNTNSDLVIDQFETVSITANDEITTVVGNNGSIIGVANYSMLADTIELENAAGAGLSEPILAFHEDPDNAGDNRVNLKAPASIAANYTQTLTDATGFLPVVLKGSATLDFASTAAGTVTDLTITVTGAADGDPVVLGTPNASVTAAGIFTAWVSATDTVTVRFANNALVTAQDPASGTFKVQVFK